MQLNGIIWIIMQYSRSWSEFTPDALLTVISLAYKKLLNHQSLDGLSIITSTIKLFAKKGIYVWKT